MHVGNDEISYKMLTTNDISMMLEMQEEVFKKIDPLILRRNDRKSFEKCFEGKSEVIGVEYKGNIIAFGILLYAGTTEENLAYDLDVKIDAEESANIKLIIVAPEYWGNGLQQKLIKKLTESAKKNKTRYLCATASPLNVYSANNFKKEGFEIVKTLEKYGGVLRDLYFKEINCFR